MTCVNLEPNTYMYIINYLTEKCFKSGDGREYNLTYKLRGKKGVKE